MKIKVHPPEVIRFREFLVSQSSAKELVELEMLSLDSLILMIFFIKSFHLEKTKNLKPVGDIEVTLSPNQALAISSLHGLVGESSMRLSQSNPLDDFTNFYNRFGGLFYHQIQTNPVDSLPYFDSMNECFRHLKWTNNIDLNRLNRLVSNHKLDGLKSNFNQQELIDYWMFLSVDECIENMKVNSQQICGHPFSANYELVEHLKKLLNVFSVSQIFTMIYSSSNSCSREIQSRSMDSLYFQLLFPKSFLNYTNKALENKWNITSHENRKYTQCRSELHRVFFRDFLKYPKDPFGLTISDSNLQMMLTR